MATCKKTLDEKLIRDGLKGHKILLFLLKNDNEPVQWGAFSGKGVFYMAYYIYYTSSSQPVLSIFWMQEDVSWDMTWI